MSPSVTWSSCEKAPIAMAIAAATAEGWNGPVEGASNRFLDSLRKMVGPDVLERIEFRAIDLFNLQPVPPEGYDPPPAWAWMQICPGCQKLRRTKHTAPQHARASLLPLRDRDWLQGRVEAGATLEQIAERVRCEPSLVRYWLDRHGLRSGRAWRMDEFDAQVRAMHLAGESPGAIARALDDKVDHVRQSLLRLKLATKKTGHHYFAATWWEERIRVRGMTKLACAKEAGIAPHAATFWVKKFGLQDLVRHNRRPVQYPVLANASTLTALLERHLDNYASAAREVGCAPSLIRLWAKKLLGREPKHSNELPHSDPDWWTTRVTEGRTTWEMSAEAGIEEKTAREKCRILGLLDRAYRNNLAHERALRRTA